MDEGEESRRNIGPNVGVGFGGYLRPPSSDPGSFSSRSVSEDDVVPTA